MIPYIIYGLVIGVASFAVLFCVWYFVVLPGKRKRMTEEAEQEAEIIKQKKLLEVKEKFISKKAELEKEVRQRNQQIQQAENRAKQRELSLNQRQDELTRRKQESDTLRTRLETQQAVLQKKEERLNSVWAVCWSRKGPNLRKFPVLAWMRPVNA